MLVDTTAFSQGVIYAEQAGDITAEQAAIIYSQLAHITRPGKHGRSVCLFSNLLGKLAGIANRFRSHEMARLWGYIGPSLVSGLIVASDEVIE